MRIDDSVLAEATTRYCDEKNALGFDPRSMYSKISELCGDRAYACNLVRNSKHPVTPKGKLPQSELMAMHGEIWGLTGIQRLYRNLDAWGTMAEFSLEKSSIIARCHCLRLLGLLWTADDHPRCLYHAAMIPWHLHLWYTVLSGTDEEIFFQQHAMLLEAFREHISSHSRCMRHPTLRMLRQGEWPTFDLADRMSRALLSGSQDSHTHYCACVELFMRLLAAHAGLSPVEEQIHTLAANPRAMPRHEMLCLLGYVKRVVGDFWHPFRVYVLAQCLLHPEREQDFLTVRAEVSSWTHADIWGTAHTLLNAIDELGVALSHGDKRKCHSHLGVIGEANLVLSKLNDNSVVYSPVWLKVF